jgi:mycothiol synthase
MDHVFQVETARPEDREAALRLLFQHLEPSERERRVANALHLMELGRLQPEGLFVARDGQGVCGTMICLPIPGASGLVWPPQTRKLAGAQGVEDDLVRHAANWLRCQGSRLGQALLTPDETHLAVALERNGFRHTTALWYMRREMALAVPRTEQSRLSLVAHDASDAALFAETLLRTYEGTCDCPEVNGVRTIDEILDGHKADAGANFSHWWLAFEGEGPVGVLLANESPEWESWEIAYIGIMPKARRQGLGRELMLKALVEARVAEVPQLTLCVDARNAPAISLYRGLGFELYDTREVYLAVWDSLG